MKIIGIVALLLCASVVYAGEYDCDEDTFLHQEEEALKYNPFTDEWSYEERDSELKYNPHDDVWSYEKQGSDLKYNPYEDRWEYGK